jgi:LacI family transcriptional regulator
MSPTMADVAQRAGVSTSTVSLVLNDKPGVSERTRAAVLEAARELGYQLPRRRPDLSTQKTILVVHFASQGPESGADLPVLAADYLSGIQDYCQGRSVNWALIAHYQEGKRRQHVGVHLLERDALACDGLILMMPPSRESVLLQQALRERIPTVVISRDWPDLPLSSVGQDHPQQAHLAMDHLVQLGHRQIGFVAPSWAGEYGWCQVRLDIYRETMVALDMYDPERIAVEPDVCQATQALLDRQPDVTAIFAVNDRAAVRAMRGLRARGIRIPEQVSVIGVGDNCPSPEGYPALTTIGFPSRKVGYLAGRLLLEQLEDEELAYGRIFVQSWVIERESCAPPRGRM